MNVSFLHDAAKLQVQQSSCSVLVHFRAGRLLDIIKM